MPTKLRYCEEITLDEFNQLANEHFVNEGIHINFHGTIPIIGAEDTRGEGMGVISYVFGNPHLADELRGLMYGNRNLKSTPIHAMFSDILGESQNNLVAVINPESYAAYRIKGFDNQLGYIETWERFKAGFP